MTSRLDALTLAFALLACSRPVVAPPPSAPLPRVIEDEAPPGILTAETCDVRVSDRALDVAAAPARTYQGCMIEDKHVSLDWLVVAPRHVAPFAVAIVDQPARVTPAERGMAEIEVKGPVRFKGVARLDWYAVGSSTYDESRALYVTPGVLVQDVRPRGALVQATIASADGPFARNVLLPCSALHVGPQPAEKVVWHHPKMAFALEAADEWHWMSAELDQTIPIEVRLSGPLSRSGSTADASRVMARFENGTYLSGWLRASLKAFNEVPDDGAEREAAPPRTCERPPAAPRLPHDEVFGTALLRPKAWIFTAPDGPGWAQTSAQTTATVAWRDGSAFVEIIELEGVVLGRNARAFVSKTDVHFDDVKRYDASGHEHPFAE